MATLHLACAANERYVPHAAASIHSFLTCTKSVRLHVHFLYTGGLKRRQAEALSSMVTRVGGQLSFHEIDADRLVGLPVRGRFGTEMWLRIFLPELLPDAERALYVDADTIAMSSVEPLVEIDLGDAYLAAVTNVFPEDHLHLPGQLGLTGAEVYFNSGVLLLNLETMRREGCSEALHRFAQEHADELMWPDQDLLNLVLGERRLPLHPRWNCMNSTMHFASAAEVYGAEALAEARRDPGIRHFEGPSINKPWHYACDRAMREAYAEHRAQTPWPEYRLEGTPLASSLRAALGRRRSPRRIIPAARTGETGREDPRAP